MASTFGGTVKLTGESEYKKALSEITSNLKVMGSELAIVTATYGKNDTSVEGLTDKNKVLNKQIDEQKNKIEVLKNALEASKNETGENSSTTQKWQTDLNKATADLIKLEKEVSSNEEVMKRSSEATDENSNSVQEFGKKADDTGKKALSLGDIIKGNLISDAIKSGLKSLASSVTEVASSFTDAIKNGTEYADNILTLSTQTGLSTETLQKYQGVAELVDVSMETLTGSMAKNIKQMASGSDAYKKLGISVRDANGNLRDSETVYWEAIDALGNIQNEAERDSLAMELFGKSAQSLNPLIAQGSEGIKEFGQDAEYMGAVLSEDALFNLGALDDEMQRFSTVTEATGNILSSAFAPSVSSIIGGVNTLGSSLNYLISSILSGDEGGIETATNEFSNSISVLVSSISENIPNMLEVANQLISTLINVISDNLPTILEMGLQLISTLLNGISNNLNTILPVIIDVIMTLTEAIIQNLPTILEAGTQVLLSLIQGISESLPTLIPVIVDALLTMVEGIIDNIDLIIDAGIDIIFALIDGLINAMPKLIDKIPVIIDKLITAITNNLPKLIQAGITLTIKIAEGLIKAVPQLVSKIPQILSSLVKGFSNSMSQMLNIGKNLIQGLWNGISNSLSWIKNKISGWVGNVFGFIKKLFGINSPSKLFKDEIGANLALGIGEGFSDEMEDVNRQIQESIPTDYDLSVNTTYSKNSSNPMSNQYQMYASILKDTLSGMNVVMDGDKIGKIVVSNIEEVVYS